MFVFRLKRTWQKIQSAGKFAVLEHQMNPSSNFLSYRATLKAAISRSEGATDQRQRIVIPFFSLLVKDLFIVNEVSVCFTAVCWHLLNSIERTYRDIMYPMKNRKRAFYIFCLKFIMYRGYTRKKSKIPIPAEREGDGEDFRFSWLF